MYIIIKGVLSIVVLVVLFVGCSKNEKSANEISFSAAKGVNGGRLYDKFWDTETGFNQSDAALITKFDTYADFFKCNQCHGWDLRGEAGSYANRAPDANRPNVANVDLFAAIAKSNSEIFSAIKTGATPALRRSVNADLSTYNPTSNKTVGDQMPDFAAILSDAQIWDLVKFLKTEFVDGKLIYDCVVSGAYPNATVAISNIGKDGNAATGDAFYTTHCSDCHGATGTDMLVDNGEYTVGAHMRAKPYEDIHKIKFGALGGSGMNAEQISTQQLKDLCKAISDAAKYPDNPPTQP